MTRYVALLRGVNVSGRNRLPMATLRAVAAEAGCTDATTYVQSGNLVCTSTLGVAALSGRLRAGLAAAGVDVPVIVRTAAQWSELVAANPFPQAVTEPKTLHVTVLQGPAGATYDRVDAEAFLPERFVVAGQHVYVFAPGGLGASKLAVALERAATKAPGTTRNWTTVREIERLLAG